MESNLEKLIKEKCSKGIEYKKIYEVTIWDKNFSGVERYMQSKIKKYKYLLANEAKSIINEGGNIYILTTGISDEKNYTTEELAGDYLCEGEIVAIPWGGTPNVKYYNGKFVTLDNRIATSNDTNVLNNKFLYYFMESSLKEISTYYRGAGIKHPSMKKILMMDIPIPPLEVQKEIVRILDNLTELTAELTSELTAELTARQKQYEYYRNKLLSFDKSAENLDTLHTHTHTHGYFYGQEIKWIKLGDIGSVCMCKRIMKNQTKTEGDIPFYKIGTFGKNADAYISKALFEEYKDKYSYPKKGTILLSASGTIGRTVIYNGEPAYFQDSNIVWIDNDERIILNKYLYYLYRIIDWKVEGGTIKRLYNDNIKNTVIPVPSLEVQEKTVQILDEFDKLTNYISEVLPAEIEARQKQYEYYRNKLLSFKELKTA